MLYTEKELQDTLKKDVTISKETEKRMQETYAQIRRDTKTSKKRGRKHSSMAAAVALAVILISGTTAGAAYISAHTDLLGNVFGQQSRTTKEAYDTVVDNGKGGTTVTMPSREYVAVDEAQAEKLEEHLENLAAYMWSEYEMTLNQAKELKKEELSSLPEIRRQIDALKEQIKSLGNINVNAIEDYREVSERYEFMRAQHEDLVNAQAELEKIIEELDIGMRRQFEEKFREIRAEFDKVFKELFGGGRGALELMEGEDLLEAGIQIIAQPPGKKLQNMMQLSGGEKALTAISLLFAIQNLKPSPFCLLDEIEAALDDSNVDRFANYLHKLTKNTQFIVITHRRGTMMAADRLYGITMQEKGVSTLVSVNLIEDSLTK